MRPLFIVTCAAVLGACSDISGIQTQEFGVAVDSIVAPDSIGPEDTLTLTLHGVIGNTDCYSFSHLAYAREPGRLDLAAVARLEQSTARSCNRMDVLLDESYEALPPFADPFRVVVHQPSDDSLVHQVIVR